jgi:uncharacterized protein (TIGR03437 family)
MPFSRKWRALLAVSCLSSVVTPVLCAYGRRAGPARRYSFSGNDPARWTRPVLGSRNAAGPTDFTVFPCDSVNCKVAQIVADSNSNVYVVGSRFFDVQGPNGTQLSDVFVARLDASGNTTFLTTIGGKGGDEGHAIAVDAAGNVIVGGSTTSPNFPLRRPFQPKPGSGITGFILKLSADGSQLLYSTYFGGTRDSSVDAVAADTAGNMYVTGWTGSPDFPTTPGLPAGIVSGFGPAGVLGAFVTKLSAAGERVLYSGVISGTAIACGNGSLGSSCFLRMRETSGNSVLLDSSGNVYLAGNTNVTDLPATAGVLVPKGVGAWAGRINAPGSKLDYLTYVGASLAGGLGLSPATLLYQMTADQEGNAYIVGSTTDPNFPVTSGALQPEYNAPVPPPYPNGPSDAFFAKLNPQGTAMAYATFLGGTGNDVATGIALDSAGQAYISGTTDSKDFPVTAASNGGNFVAVLNATGSALSFSSRYPAGVVSPAIAVGPGHRILLGGQTGLVSSLDWSVPAVTRIWTAANAAGAQNNPIIAPGELISLYGTNLGPAVPVVAQTGGDGRMPAELAGTQVLVNGIAAPLLYVAGDQINAVTPFPIAPGDNTTIQVVAGQTASIDFPAAIVSAQPGIFQNGQGAAAINQDGTVNSESNPSKVGSVIAFWATGAGRVYPTPVDGEVAAAAVDYRCCEVYVYDKPAEVLYAGAAPGMVAGVIQVNFRVPEGAASIAGPVPVTLRVFLANPLAPPASMPAWIYVAP